MMRSLFQNTKPFGQLVALFLFMLAGFVLYMVISVVMMFAGVELLHDTHVLRLSQIMSQLFIFVLPAVLWALCFGAGLRDNLQLRFGGRYWLAALAGLFCYLLSVPLINAVTNWNAGWVLPEPLAELCRQMTAQSEAVMRQLLVPMDGVGVLLFNLLVVAVTPALCEELFFRGALQTTLIRGLRNPHLAIWIASFVFSLFHGDVYGLVPRWLLGLLMGYLYYYSGSLLVNVLMHFVNNAIAVLCYYLYYEHGVAAANPDVQVEMAGWIVALCALAAVAFFYCFFMLKYKKSELKA